MKLIEDNSGMFPGESSMIPVCSVCGCKTLYKQSPGILQRLKNCPSCNHKLDWGNMSLKGCDLNDEKKIDELANALHMVIADNPEIFTVEVVTDKVTSKVTDKNN